MNNDLVRWLLDVDAIPKDAAGVELAWERPFAAWIWVLLIVTALAFAVWSYSRLSGPVVLRRALAAIRFVLLLVVLIIFAGPLLKQPRETVEEDWVLVLADRSRSMEIADVQEAGQRLSRDQQLRRAVDGSADLWERLGRERHLVWLGFHSGAFNLAADEAGSARVDLGTAAGEQTSLGAAIGQALQQAAARPVSGVVVFSDGRTTDPPDRSLVRQLQAEGIPVFVIPLGSPVPIGDLAIRGIEAPRRAFIGDKVPVVVEIDRLGAFDGETPATIRLIDQGTGEELDRVQLGPGDDTQRVTLTADPTLVGEANWQVVLEGEKPDLIPDNNAKPFVIELIDRPLRILYVEGYPRWEYRYLKNLLVREESLDSSVMLLSADRDFAQEGNQPITRLPRSPEEFAQFDVIIIGDVPGNFFSLDQLEMIRSQVADRGTGLLWIAGDRSTPRSYAGSSLADLLPVRGSLALAPIGQPVNMRPTALADRLGVLQLRIRDEVGWPVDLSDPSYRWSRLQYAQLLEPGRLKPTAEVLAETSQEIDGTALPLVVRMRYGAGQSIYVASDEIWRWRYGRGEVLPEQFWIQMIRMLGRESLTGAGRRGSLEVAPRRVALGQPVRIDLRLLDAELADTRRSSASAVVVDAEGETLTEVELRRLGADEERYAATYLPGTTGALRVRLEDPTLSGVDLEAVVEVFAPEDELRRPETDHPLLAELAESTNGRTLAPAQLNELEELLPKRSVRTLNPLTERIWDTPLFFGLIVLLITLEWIGRKAARLP